MDREFVGVGIPGGNGTRDFGGACPLKIHVQDLRFFLYGKIKIEKDARLGTFGKGDFGKGEAQPARPGRGRELGVHTGIEQVHGVEARRGNFGFLVESRAGARRPHRTVGTVAHAGECFGLTGVQVEFPDGGHDAQAGQAHGVQVAKTRNTSHSILVAAIPQTFSWLSGLNLTIPNGRVGLGNNTQRELEVPMNGST